MVRWGVKVKFVGTEEGGRNENEWLKSNDRHLIGQFPLGFSCPVNCGAAHGVKKEAAPALCSAEGN